MTTTYSDLTDRGDVRELLSRFYARVLVDELLAEPFTEVRAKGLDAHLPGMCDFWETMLFRAGLYQGSALHAHRAVHRNHPLTHRHFVRWLWLWRDTVDAMYHGPVAEQAKLLAGRIAWAMHRRLNGGDAPELDAFVARELTAGRRV